MRAAAAAWLEQTGVEIAWDARPPDEPPVAELAERYDLLFVGHPAVGAAAGSLAPLDELLDAEALRDVSVGPSHASYRYDGHQWALAVDAGCQVSAERPSLMGGPVPDTWDEVLALAREAPGAVALPLQPSDALCALLTLCANAGRPVEGVRGFDPNAISLLAALAARVDPACFDADAPALLDRMRDGDAIVYVPLTFGYTKYSRADDPNIRLRFGEIPGTAGAILGGSGLAVSAASAHAGAAAAFAAWVCDAEAQRGLVGPAGGQPAHRAAWDDTALDAVCGRFFSNTRATLEAAWMRPRDPWWPGFQREAGALLVAELRARSGAVDIAWRLNALLGEHRVEPSPTEADGGHGRRRLRGWPPEPGPEVA